MTATLLRFACVLCTLLLSAALASPAIAQSTNDYDPQSTAWNGLVEVVRIAQQAHVELRPSAELDWSLVRRGDALLVLYPLSSVDLDELSAFLEDGGRLALLDDFGSSSPLLRWFQVTRSEAVQGTLRSSQLPGFYVAMRRGDHLLGEQVDSVITNEPVVLRHPRLAPVFALDEAGTQGVVLAGQVGQGRLVLGGDPSILINSMLRFRGNRQFASNLLTYLASSGGRIHLVHGRFSSRNSYEGTNARRRSPLKTLSKQLDRSLLQLSAAFAKPPVLTLLALLAVLLVSIAFATRMWGSRPSDRFGPISPPGPMAGAANKALLFTRKKANLLYPTLLLRRVLERSILQRLGLRPPVDLSVAITRAESLLAPERRESLRAVLRELNELAERVEARGRVRVSLKRFVSLWRQISAILADLSTP
ncbi:MAG: DUF4350 domain-containing protein [Deltaproteobacteria bacterium]|nr:DUF4350 domain-containing protein [Deltaproteobacteria bacterium]